MLVLEDRTPIGCVEEIFGPGEPPPWPPFALHWLSRGRPSPWLSWGRPSPWFGQGLPSPWLSWGRQLSRAESQRCVGLHALLACLEGSWCGSPGVALPCVLSLLAVCSLLLTPGAVHPPACAATGANPLPTRPQDLPTPGQLPQPTPTGMLFLPSFSFTARSDEPLLRAALRGRGAHARGAAAGRHCVQRGQVGGVCCCPPRVLGQWETQLACAPLASRRSVLIRQQLLPGLEPHRQALQHSRPSPACWLAGSAPPIVLHHSPAPAPVPARPAAHPLPQHCPPRLADFV